MAESTEVYDLLVLVDATYSMSSYLSALQTSLPQITQISTLTGCFSRIGLLAYRDYCDKEKLDWSGWLTPTAGSASGVDLVAKARALCPSGGGDGPEATKTGLARSYELMRADATTIILLFTDAPPHSFSNGSLSDKSSNYGSEQRALSIRTSYGGYGPLFSDWVSAANTLRSGDKKAQVFTILERNMRFEDAGYYNYLSSMTGGACFYLSDSSPASISKVTVEILLAWMGAGKASAAAEDDLPAYFTRYVDAAGIVQFDSEKNLAACNYFLATSVSSYDSIIPAAEKAKIKLGAANITKIKVSTEVLKKFLPKKETPVVDFAKRYAKDASYKQVAIQELKKIINADVAAITINPVFGSLWRAVASDRNNETRDELITAFSLQVDRITNADEKARVKSWLEESYDFTAEVMEAIESVPHAQRFPCVCLDPTLSFNHGDNGDEDDRPITEFRRDELLEIGRSCDYKILRRLGRVMTRLTYIKSANKVPAHIAAVPEVELPRIPLALASAKYNHKFWKILLHIVVPGTMLGPRPAALLAALSLKLGIQPLKDAADQEMMLWRDKWNTLDIPETWNTSCLSLLLDADEAYWKRKELENDIERLNLDVSVVPLVAHCPCDDESSAKRLRLDPTSLTSLKENGTTKVRGLLRKNDQYLFHLLVSYKMLEFNLDTNLNARIGWTPDRTMAPLGPTVICKSCEFPRSVTIMGNEGKCGHCLWTEYNSPQERKEQVEAHVTKDDNKNTLATWVECNLANCRAQYVVYRVENLNVKPKCHYCRFNKEAPLLECVDCKNRVIYPYSYRPSDLKVEEFKCYACTSGRKTIVDVETTANNLRTENGTNWLLRNDKKKIAVPFNKRSLFHLLSTAGVDEFYDKVALFPTPDRTILTIHGKLIRNAPELVTSLQSWVSRRQTESGTCSLCCSSMRKSKLLRACGRSGCPQSICESCLQSWYGLNAPGRIINTSALSCAFCRRSPTPKMLAKYGQGIHAVGNLRLAVEEKGEWIHAWCRTCGFAKQYMERACAAGAPAEVSDWSCDDCKGHKGAKLKACPGCGTLTEKTSGCDHITCTVPHCGTHWCFFCGEKQTPSIIYNHMRNEHGGYYGGRVHENDDEVEDEDDEYDSDY